jgi:hypothetical protein
MTFLEAQQAAHRGGHRLVDADAVADGYPAENGEVPLPDWSAFADEDLTDLDDTARAEFRARNPVARARHPRPAAAHRRPPPRRARHRHRDRVHQREAPALDRAGRAICAGIHEDPPRRLRRPAHRPLAAVHPARGTWAGDPGLNAGPAGRVTTHGPPGRAGSSGTSPRGRRDRHPPGLPGVPALKHLAYAEDDWFSRSLHGRDRQPPWVALDWKAAPRLRLALGRRGLT